jgi:hypothetical protein
MTFWERRHQCVKLLPRRLTWLDALHSYQLLHPQSLLALSLQQRLICAWMQKQLGQSWSICSADAHQLMSIGSAH